MEVGQAMAESPPPPHLPYTKLGSSATNDSGLDLPLDKDDLGFQPLGDAGAIMSSSEASGGVATGETEQPVVAAEEEIANDGDSALGSDASDSYASLTSEAREYVFENGRRYHGYKSGRYMLPNDENEMDREDMKHHISMLITEGHLHLAPIDPNSQLILDVGTGTGIWAIEMANLYPSAKIVATDLSPIQPAWVPPNLIFEIDDAEDEWLYKPNTVDFVHARYLFHGIRDWPRFLDQSMNVLKPGGWVEIVEMHVIPSTYDNTLPPQSQILEFYNVLADIGVKIGIDLAVARKFHSMIAHAGFTDVTERAFDLPIGDWWPDGDRRMCEVGLFHRFQMVEGLHGIAFGLLTRVAGWTVQKVEAFLAGVRKEMKDQNVHCFYKLYFVYGRKPMEPLDD